MLWCVLLILKTKWFARFARQERIPDASLREAIEQAERGLIDADLGGSLIKLRVPRRGEGRSGGYRMIVAYRIGELAVFLYGFTKSDQENLSSEELQTAKDIATTWFAADSTRIDAAIANHELQEIPDGDEKT